MGILGPTWALGPYPPYGFQKKKKSTTSLQRKMKLKILMPNQSTIKQRQHKERTLGSSFPNGIDALFALKCNTATGRYSILTGDIDRILETRITQETWKNLEIQNFLQKMIT